MGFNFATDNSIRGRVARFAESISPAERAAEKARKEYLKGVIYGDKIYFRVESLKVSNFYTAKYIVFYTNFNVVKAPFLNKKQMDIFNIIVNTSGKGYIQEVEKDGQRFKEITQLERCPQIPKGLEKAIESGLAISLN